MKERKEITAPQDKKIPVSVVFLGPPASGKGTTAAYLEELHGIKPISPGNIFKSLRNSDSEVSKLIIETTKNGGLCPDWLTNQIVKDGCQKLIDEGIDSISLDGYPRTIEQLNYLLQNYDVKLFVHSSSNFMRLKKMVSNRRNCSTCKRVFSKDLIPKNCTSINKDNCALISESFWEVRWDDNPEFFKKRYDVYLKETQPIVSVISKFDNYVKLDLLKEENYKFIETFLKLNS